MRIKHRLRLLVSRKQRAAEVKRSGCVFIAVPRTSSSALDDEMMGHFGKVHGRVERLPGVSPYRYYPPHLTALEMRQQLGPVWNEVYRFSVVRNPWDRTLSFYRLRVNDGHFEGSFTDYVAALEQRDKRWFRFAPTWMDAFSFVSDGKNIIVDKVVRYEDRETGLAEVRQSIGHPTLGTQISNVSGETMKYREHYTDANAETVGRLFARDVKTFNYTF